MSTFAYLEGSVCHVGVVFGVLDIPPGTQITGLLVELMLQNRQLN